MVKLVRKKTDIEETHDQEGCEECQSALLEKAKWFRQRVKNHPMAQQLGGVGGVACEHCGNWISFTVEPGAGLANYRLKSCFKVHLPKKLKGGK